jgi:hypothetical protein
MKNKNAHILIALTVILLFSYQIYSGIGGVLSILMLLFPFVFFLGGGFFILDIGHRLNAKRINCTKFYLLASTMFFYFSVFCMVIGVITVFTDPAKMESPLYAAYGLFISSGIMKEKFKENL